MIDALAPRSRGYQADGERAFVKIPDVAAGTQGAEGGDLNALGQRRFLQAPGEFGAKSLAET